LLNQVLPEAEHWRKYGGANEEVRKERLTEFWSAFRINSTKLEPEEKSDGPAQIPKTMKDIKKQKWRNAGPLSHQKSAAALAYLLVDYKNKFSNMDSCWTGKAIKICRKLYFFGMNGQNWI